MKVLSNFAIHHIKYSFLLISILLLSSSSSNLCQAGNLDDAWVYWKNLHQKYYLLQDEFRHRDIWEQNLEFIEKHNFLYDFGVETYMMGLNQFADLTWSDFQVKYLNSLNLNEESFSQFKSYELNPDSDLPTEVDWRKYIQFKNIDQGGCASGWAFSATDALRSRYVLAGEDIELSVQQLIDCTFELGSRGCKGGLFSSAYQYLLRNGLESGYKYPYQGWTSNCKYDHCGPTKKASTVMQLVNRTDDDLKSLVYLTGPISVGFGVDKSLVFYQSGIYTSKTCSTTHLNHGLLLIGYGKQNEFQYYWTVKNSWGSDWGENGFVRIDRNQKNVCGIRTVAIAPIIN